MTEQAGAYEELIRLRTEATLLGSTGAVLGWDEQTYMPQGGAEHRANQLSLITGLAHEQMTAPRIGELLSELESSKPFGEDAPEAADIREIRREYDRKTKLPKRLVEEMSRVGTLSQQAWISARSQKDFSKFEPWLEQTLALKKEEAQAVSNGEGNLYDALLDDYEPGMKSEDVAAAFAELKAAIVPLVASIQDSPRQPDTSILKRAYPEQLQQRFSRTAAEAIGFDFHRGRIDVTAHPFCSSFGPGDTRLTTRYDENFFSMAFFGVLHEAGHGMYEQGLNPQLYGTPRGESVSLGIHESQSLTWETFVGRSLPFWQHFFPQAQEIYPDALREVTLEEFYHAINDVRPSYIRVEADEVTYSLHIFLRFEIEQLLVGGDLAVADVQDAWNEKFRESFGFEVDHAAHGVLQDIHWSAGLIGYFPTYALGKMYAAQLFEQAKSDLGDLDAMFSTGEFAPLKAWLNKNIHSHGRQYPPAELIKRITGAPPSPKPLINYLTGKFGTLYEV
ncbi:carboxypeptidase M32 [Calycomorphotria hydatis]|nr:carboxypeptidase M32 [Calycomorphotria hydatis]